jgi:hypothetical protein
MKPPLITNKMQRKDISKYIYKYFIEKDEKENYSVGWSLLLGYRNYIMHCFVFPVCVITCYLEVYDAEV